MPAHSFLNRIARLALVTGIAHLTGAGLMTNSAWAQSQNSNLCRPDVRRFCHLVRPDAGDDAFLACLQANRAKLSPNCRQVLESNGV
ncbi:hypothetical protein CCR94_08025 [Rhodoblastus sphagnicola]|uniref:Cysteine rich repeat protein n=1 Tax=Rhodoblastus sphagnicola TaxID=333368 RepID=A0A2S6NBC3_9HYPH|nr:hypothetical protein [Rhodoblastus sphagnicola]MBB4197765.1 hypothetical protein [Rhodoblastus sphagnicola]PPQ31909.1 hypothetical protein CCR94_08025 [Rhodoblastus sphagnicola]